MGYCAFCGTKCKRNDNFCKNCGAKIGYCTSCGTKCKHNDNFCKNCGAKIISDSTITKLTENQTHNNGDSKRNKRILTIVSLILCSALLGVLLFNILSKPIGLNVEYSEQGISSFLKKVCKKVPGKASLASSNSDSPGNMYGECYIPVVKVKQVGKVAEEIPIRFYNSGSSDTVSRVEMILYSYATGGFTSKDYENIFECEIALLTALEKTVAGKSYVEDYLTSYWDVYKEIKKGEISKKKVLATYNLSDELTVVIKTENGGNAWSDRVYYTLEKESSWYMDFEEMFGWSFK